MTSLLDKNRNHQSDQTMYAVLTESVLSFATNDKSIMNKDYKQLQRPQRRAGMAQQESAYILCLKSECYPHCKGRNVKKGKQDVSIKRSPQSLGAPEKVSSCSLLLVPSHILYSPPPFLSHKRFFYLPDLSVI